MAGTSNNRLDLERVVSRDPEVHGGDLVLSGTRVPVQALIDYLKGPDSVDDFLADFSTVQRAQVEAYLDLSPDGVEQLRKAL